MLLARMSAALDEVEDAVGLLAREASREPAPGFPSEQGLRRRRVGGVSDLGARRRAVRQSGGRVRRVTIEGVAHLPPPPPA